MSMRILTLALLLTGFNQAFFLGKNAEDYLTKFGYLPQSDLETGAQRTEDQLMDAVRNLQVKLAIFLTLTNIFSSFHCK